MGLVAEDITQVDDRHLEFGEGRRGQGTKRETGDGQCATTWQRS